MCQYIEDFEQAYYDRKKNVLAIEITKFGGLEFF